MEIINLSQKAEQTKQALNRIYHNNIYQKDKYTNSKEVKDTYR